MQERFRNVSATFNENENPCAVFYSPSKEVGEIRVYEYENEVVIGLGEISRRNFEGLKAPWTLEEKEEFIEDVLQFLEKLLAGEIEFWGTTAKGGFRSKTYKPRGFFSRLFFGKKLILGMDR